MFSSTTEKIIKIITTVAAICGILTFLVVYVIPNLQEKTPKKQKEKTIENSSESGAEIELTHYQKIADQYIPLCLNIIFPIETWEKYSKTELYYIRNGIYAYEGMQFEGDFFEKFEWYKGDIPLKDFPEGRLNYNQNKNVANIEKAEKSK